MGFPLEIITLLGSGLLSGVMTMWGMSLKAKAEANKQLIDRATLRGKLTNEARQMKGEGVSFTRRLIVLTVMASVFVLPFVASIMGFPINIGYTEFSPGFLFIEGKDVTKWVAVEGLAITPLHTHAAMSIIGYYFGSRVGRYPSTNSSVLIHILFNANSLYPFGV